MKRDESDRVQLITILQNAYSGELAAARAYNGHWKSVKNRGEREQIRKIEMEEWDHRRRVGIMLGALGGKPLKLKEIKLGIIGRVIAIGCHLIGWFLPMYFAGRLEAGNVSEYDDAAAHAHNFGLEAFELDLRDMADVEREHEEFFLTLILDHPMLPTMRKLFGWGGSVVEGARDEAKAVDAL